MDALPFPAHLYRRDGLVVRVNRANQEFWGIPPEAVVGLFNMYENPHADPAVGDALREAFNRNPQTLAPIEIDLEQLGLAHICKKKAWMENVLCPIKEPSGDVHYVLLLQRDVTDLIEKQQEVKQAHGEIALQRRLIDSLEEAKRELAAQRETIQALSSPIIEVWNGVLTLPVVGLMSAERATDMTERLLAAVVNTRAAYVIIDLTGISDVDEATAAHFSRILQAIELLGARGLVAGVQPAVASALISIGVNLSAVRTHRNLRDALMYCMREGGR